MLTILMMLMLHWFEVRHKNEPKWSRFLSRFDNNEDDTSWFETTKRGKLVTDDDVTITLDEKMKSVLTNTYGLTLPHNN